MVTSRPGRSTVGCLLTLLVLVAAGYFSMNLGGAYWKYYQYQDAMRQELKFNGGQPDSVILAHLWTKADSLDLPPDARDIAVDRDPKERTIRLSAEYEVDIELPMFVRRFHFDPHAEDTY
ncbi:MAG TPA: hypothetical protein VFK16_03100 [Gemmatimonadaceae bacterium]|jgi:hypothetical protein|nr:hypothetical protein [Gemmatimonadaceae bacterium]